MKIFFSKCPAGSQLQESGDKINVDFFKILLTREWINSSSFDVIFESILVLSSFPHKIFNKI